MLASFDLPAISEAMASQPDTNADNGANDLPGTVTPTPQSTAGLESPPASSADGEAAAASPVHADGDIDLGDVHDASADTTHLAGLGSAHTMDTLPGVVNDGDPLPGTPEATSKPDTARAHPLTAKLDKIDLGLSQSPLPSGGDVPPADAGDAVDAGDDDNAEPVRTLFVNADTGKDAADTPAKLPTPVAGVVAEHIPSGQVAAGNEPPAQLTPMQEFERHAAAIAMEDAGIAVPCNYTRGVLAMLLSLTDDTTARRGGDNDASDANIPVRPKVEDLPEFQQFLLKEGVYKLVEGMFRRKCVSPQPATRLPPCRFSSCNTCIACAVGFQVRPTRPSCRQRGVPKRDAGLPGLDSR